MAYDEEFIKRVATLTEAELTGKPPRFAKRLIYDVPELTYPTGDKRKVLTADGAWRTPQYSSQDCGGSLVNAVINMRNIGVSGFVLINDPPIFEPHAYGRNANLLPSWHSLDWLKPSYDIEALKDKMVGGTPLNEKELEYYLANIPPTPLLPPT
jgi:hypothetical protein